MNSYIKETRPWLVAFLISSLFFIFIIYIIAPNLLDNTIIFIIIFMVLLIFFLVRAIKIKNKKRKKLLKDFLINNSFEAKDALVEEFGRDYKKIFEGFEEKIKYKDKALEDSRNKLISYKNFIEMWTHEIKTPLAFSNLLIENHRQSLDRDFLTKLALANTNIENYINQVLYYARVDSSKKDYKMDSFKIKELLEEAMKSYYPLIAEEGIIVKEDIKDVGVFTDKNTAVFIISQILSNSIKYSNGKIEIYNIGKNLYIKNNGPKVADQDLAFIFEKAFTGEVDRIHKSTGMGLYLSKMYAGDLNLDLEVVSNKDGDFIICLSF